MFRLASNFVATTAAFSFHSNLTDEDLTDSVSSLVELSAANSLMELSRSAFPGNKILKEQDTITKSYGATEATSAANAKRHYFLEKRILRELDEYKHVCDDGLQHFPKLLSYDDESRKLSISYVGQAVLNQNKRQFNEHKSFCIENLNEQALIQQAHCVVETLAEARVRHLDLLCKPYAYRNVVIDQKGTLSLIDFDMASIDDSSSETLKKHSVKNLKNHALKIEMKCKQNGDKTNLFLSQVADVLPMDALPPRAQRLPRGLLRTR